MRFFLALLMVFPLLAGSVDFGGIDPSQMEPVVNQAQICLAELDQNEVTILTEEANQVRGNVETLCKEGQRDAAQAQSLDYVKKALQKPVVKEFQDCMGPIGQTAPLLVVFQLQNPEMTGTHVCKDVNSYFSDGFPLAGRGGK